jgi:hypothetical protein
MADHEQIKYAIEPYNAMNAGACCEYRDQKTDQRECRLNVGLAIDAVIPTAAAVTTSSDAMKLISLGSTGFICDSPSLSSGLFCERSRSV